MKTTYKNHMTKTLKKIPMTGSYSKVEILRNDKVYIRVIYRDNEVLFTRTTFYDNDGNVEKMHDIYPDGTTNYDW